MDLSPITNQLFRAITVIFDFLFAIYKSVYGFYIPMHVQYPNRKIFKSTAFIFKLPQYLEILT